MSQANDVGGGQRRAWLSQQSLADGVTGAPEEPCACIVPRPQAEGLDAEMGWPVPLSVCRTYRELNPGHADCVNADWNPVL